MNVSDFNQFSVYEVAAQLGRAFNGSVCQPCLVCTSSDAMKINTDNTVHCYSCGFHGGPLKIVAAHYDISPMNSIQKFRNLFNLEEYKMRENNNTQKAQNIWNQSEVINLESPCLKYFENRSIELSELPANLRYFKKENALVMPFFDKSQNVTGIHRTYLDGSYNNVKENDKRGNKRSKKRALGVCKGLIMSYSCLTEKEYLIIAEGLEKTASLRTLLGPANYGIAYSTSILKNQDTVTQIKDAGYKHVLICADNDLMCQGVEAASVLFFNLGKFNISAKILRPKVLGKDWDDIISGGAA